MMTWTAGELRPLPGDFSLHAAGVPVTEGFFSINCNGNEYNVHMKTASPVKGEARFSVLLLHGASFTSQTWQDVLTLQMIAMMGFSAVAIDLPGWGQTKGYYEDSEEKAEFIDAFIKQVGLDRPVIVSPSMSGSFSLPYLFRDADSCGQKARGFIALAPVGMWMLSPHDCMTCTIPVMAVRGSRDLNLGLAAEWTLQNLLNMQYVVMENAGHDCYLDNPDEWHMYLYNFLTSLDSLTTLTGRTHAVDNVNV